MLILSRQQVETARNKANRQDCYVIVATKYVDVATTEALVKTGIQHIGEKSLDKSRKSIASKRV